ncbi:MAG: MoaD/ThiS family protein [Nanohaloarchaea archaeon]|nr:MoaD/ThiS family protein [Candidatus Nanohaloarchaea archaeon]
MIEIEFVRDDLESEKEKNLEVEEGTTIEYLLEEEGIEAQEVLVAKNGTIISGKHELEDGDSLTVMDVIAGG